MNEQDEKLKNKNTLTEIEWLPVVISREKRDSDIRKILTSLPLFSNLSQRDWREFSDLFHLRTYSDEEVIFEHDTPGLGMYIIIEGSARVLNIDCSEIETEVVLLGSGDFFGEMSLVEEMYRSATIIAVGKTQLVGIFRPQLIDLMHRRPKLGLLLMERLAIMIISRLREANKRLAAYRERIRELEKQ
ncbi:MAG: cyclic nucleotide-binding domain-containing protein [Calditrichaeota bacterium]|nr:cyclic nucleotide-binding domain-containing protein [Calditrichota bacterium]